MLKSCSDLQIPQIPIQVSICGMCWTNRFNLQWLHLTSYRIWRICC